MKLTMGAMFRNSADYVDRYFAQVAGLRKDHEVHLVLAAGDSSDQTVAKVLEHLGPGDHLSIINHDGPRYGSVDHPDRWRQISEVFSKLVTNVTDVGDAFVWAEADLLWMPEDIVELVHQLEWYPAVCPMVFAADGHRFYDIWGYRKDGAKFDPYPPYHPGLTSLMKPTVSCPTPVAIDSCGSCFVCRPEVFPEVVEWGGYWPLRLKSQLWLDMTVAVTHP